MNFPMGRWRFERDVLARAQAGEPEAREHLVEQNKPLVLSISERFTVPPHDREDLIQAGCVGLLKAIDGFDPDRGNAFSTYAVPHILGEMKKFLRSRKSVDVSVNARRLLRRVVKKQSIMASRQGQMPPLKEVAESMGIDPEEITLAREALREPLRPEEDDAIFAKHQEYLERTALNMALNELDERERHLLHLRYFEDMTQAEVAEHLEYSQAHISRLESSILRRLRQHLSLPPERDCPPG